jgi:hypothetical protein
LVESIEAAGGRHTWRQSAALVVAPMTKPCGDAVGRGDEV